MINPPAYRGLSDAFLDALDQLVDDGDRGQWWRDVLAHPDLILAVRRESINVYYRGASLFRVVFRRGRPVPFTHVKYLVRQRQALAELGDTGTFGLDAQALFWKHYAGPQTLTEMMQAAAVLTGAEKSGLHPLIQASLNVVDVEIALAGEGAADDEAELDTAEDLTTTIETQGTPEPKKPGPPRQDRIDVASLESRGHPKDVWLVFHEAKHYTNPALRAAPKKHPPVLDQIGRYRSSIATNAGGLSYSYPYVCQALVRFDALRRKVRTGHPAWVDRPQPELDPIIGQLASFQRSLKIEAVPRLVVFGFDMDQRDGALSDIRQRLEQEHGVTVYAVGRTQGVKATPAFQPSKAVLAEQAKLMAAINAATPAEVVSAPVRIALPEDAPSGLSLFFDTKVAGAMPVYLCNAGEAPLSEVTMTSGAPTGDALSSMKTAKLDQPDAVLPPSAGVLVGRYHPMWDGDALTGYEVNFTGTEGARYRAQAFVTTGGSPKRWIKLKPALMSDASTVTAGPETDPEPQRTS